MASKIQLSHRRLNPRRGHHGKTVSLNRDIDVALPNVRSTHVSRAPFRELTRIFDGLGRNLGRADRAFSRGNFAGGFRGLRWAGRASGRGFRNPVELPDAAVSKTRPPASRFLTAQPRFQTDVRDFEWTPGVGISQDWR